MHPELRNKFNSQAWSTHFGEESFRFSSSLLQSLFPNQWKSLSSSSVSLMLEDSAKPSISQGWVSLSPPSMWCVFLFCMASVKASTHLGLRLMGLEITNSTPATATGPSLSSSWPGYFSFHSFSSLVLSSYPLASVLILLIWWGSTPSLCTLGRYSLQRVFWFAAFTLPRDSSSLSLCLLLWLSPFISSSVSFTPTSSPWASKASLLQSHLPLSLSSQSPACFSWKVANASKPDKQSSRSVGKTSRGGGSTWRSPFLLWRFTSSSGGVMSSPLSSVLLSQSKS